MALIMDTDAAGTRIVPTGRMKKSKRPAGQAGRPSFEGW
jgi:hypothetical protein